MNKLRLKTIRKSHKREKKWDAVFEKDGKEKVVPFGQKGYSDYTLNKDPARRLNYIKRHSNEDWSRSNVASAAWLSRYILWEKPTLQEAISNANRMRSDVQVSLK